MEFVFHKIEMQRYRERQGSYCKCFLDILSANFVLITKQKYLAGKCQQIFSVGVAGVCLQHTRRLFRAFFVYLPSIFGKHLLLEPFAVTCLFF